MVVGEMVGESKGVLSVEESDETSSESRSPGGVSSLASGAKGVERN